VRSSAAAENQTLTGRIQQIPQKLSLPQDSALTAPRLETESQPVFRRAQNLHRNLPAPSNPLATTNCDTHGKVNRSAPKVNPFFGSLLIKIFQKQDLLKSEKTAMLSRQ
jgi:hypothetical protein